MKKYLIPTLLLAIISLSCGKNKVYQTWIQTYTINPAYNGSHRTDLMATYYINESKSDVKIEVNLQNIETNLAEDYIISIHAAAPSSTLGFEKQYKYDIGKSSKLTTGAIAILVLSEDFETIKNFDGFLVIQDPNQLGIDSLPQLLMAQKLN